MPDGNKLYLGYTEVREGDVARFENAVSRKTALTVLLFQATRGQEKVGKLDFDLSEAKKASESGYALITGAYEAKPFPGFTVDRLLKGEFDSELKKLATKFRQYGKPMFFSTAREPNSALVETLGGFGPAGDKNRIWADTSEKKLGLFDPTKYSKNHLANKNLYKGLGDPQACDGLERLAAAQRYYYDFFVDREKLQNLSFESMGWNVQGEDKLQGSDVPPCNDYSKFLEMLSGYVDWVSINWYFYKDPGDAEEPSLEQTALQLNAAMKKIRKAFPGKPVLITELGFCESAKGKTVGEKLQYGLKIILDNFPEIKGAIHWGDGGEKSHFACGITSQQGGSAYREIMATYSNRFSSCVRYSDGSTIPNCDAKKVLPIEK